jgi:hypothetical protein
MYVRVAEPIFPFPGVRSARRQCLRASQCKNWHAAITSKPRLRQRLHPTWPTRCWRKR